MRHLALLAETVLVDCTGEALMSTQSAWRQVIRDKMVEFSLRCLFQSHLAGNAVLKWTTPIGVHRSSPWLPVTTLKLGRLSDLPLVAPWRSSYL